MVRPGGAHAPASSDRIFHDVDLRDVSRMSPVSAGNGSDEGHAMEKMMPTDKKAKMRECEKRAVEQKIKMQDRFRFVDECVWDKTK
jgi:hypothetical protein